MENHVPGDKTPLSLTRELSEAIRWHSFEALQVLPLRGAEVGGVITGARSSPSLAENIELVTCEYLFGSPYVLSASDLAGLRETVRRVGSEGHAVAAYFRSCTRSHTRVEPEDQEAIAQACPDVPFAVIARPFLNGSARIHIFRRSVDGDWKGEADFDVAPPPRQAITSGQLEPPQDVPDAIPPPGMYRRWALFVSASLVILFALTALWLERRHASVSGDPSAALAAKPSAGRESNPVIAPHPAFDLTVHRENGMLHVTWNRDSKVVRTAVSGALEIVDSNNSKLIPLLNADISAGSIVYLPHSSDVIFRLQLMNSAGESFGEMVRILDDGAIAAPVRNALVVPVSPLSEPKRTLRTRLGTEANTGSTALAAQEQQSSTGQAASVTNRTELFVAPPVEFSSTNLAAESIPEVLTGVPIPAIPAVRPAVMVPPQPLSRVLPTITDGMSGPWLVRRPIKVIVVVSVNEQGKVFKARATGSDSGFLSELASNAAKQWTFKPATVGGVPVVGEYTMNFTFQPRF